MSPFFNSVYKNSLTLLTDFYQLTMAYGYWKSGLAEKESVFQLYFRKNPFKSGYTVASGLELAIEYINNFKFNDDDIGYLKTLKGNDDKCLFDNNFLNYLKNLKFTCSLHAVPEGTVVFPNEPILRISGSLLQCQLLETPLLNIINFHSLISTKAARIVSVANGHPVLELGLRRAQGIDGALSASRAAFIGGCLGTSNTLAGKIFGIPVKGTHSHSWVMAFENELESFYALAHAMPNNVILLVDTYNTIEGIKKAIEIGNWLKSKNKKLTGIRLDSGDLAYLSIEARKLLDEAGFRDTIIVASNDLNEHVISSLNEQKSAITTWGVGTQLVTAFDEPALGAVYKLTAIKNNDNTWKYCIKLSEQSIKISTPGILQVRRFQNKSQFFADMIFDELNPPQNNSVPIIDPEDPNRFYNAPANSSYEDILKPIFINGKLIYQSPSLQDIQSYAFKMREMFHPSIKRLLNPHNYPAGLEKNLHDLKMKLIRESKVNVEMNKDSHHSHL
ncbi:nicotinate phosphoribosyltransferase [Silvanigrella aquatica]|uniref:Nicotinate phosphoribosyltransferase n=1 Tax=Silvanigrella aquatica TaxID=1915309 RepID=A0A1L4D3F8_9BACT|nr:nicotinate phosphoribosyltransferase [Silvanigrella aquatica]APJ04733.1 nicotinate phosphoribosyltransferase [Silvanigrella aquatica]